MESVLVMISCPPYGTETAFAGLRCCLALKAMGEITQADVLCLGEGVYNCLIGQQSEEALGMPGQQQVLEDLALVGSRVWVVEEDWQSLGLTPDLLTEGVAAIPADEIPTLIQRYQGIFNF